VSGPEQATPLSIKATKAYVFDKALAVCDREQIELENELHDLLDRSDSPVLSALETLFPRFKVQSLNSVQVLFDSFGKLAEAFASFYIPAQAKIQPTISLDCSRATKFSIPALLGHELAHHLNSQRELSPWIDEMLAQMTEVRIRNSFSTERYEDLQNSYQVPSFFARDKAFKSTHEYGINALFGAYLLENFGGPAVLAALPKGTKTVTDLSRAVLKFSQTKKSLDWIRQYITPRSMIRHFNLALNINLPSINGGKIFTVPGWNGFHPNAVIKKTGSYILEPGGSLRLDPMWAPDFVNLPKSSSLEIYRVLTGGNQYQILNLGESSDGYWEQNFLVLINTSETDYVEITLK